MTKERNIFEVLTDYAVNERISRILLTNSQYQDVQRKIDNQIEVLNQQKLSKEQERVVDVLVSLHTESGALYGRMTYQQGYRDAVTLLQEMHLIKAL